MKVIVMIKLLLILSSGIVCISTTQSTQIKVLRQRFTKDIQRLNNKLTSIKQHPITKIQIQTNTSSSNKQQQQAHTIQLQQQNISITSNQLIQLDLSAMSNLNIIDTKITQQSSTNSNSKKTTALKKQFNNNNNNNTSSCKFIDPQLTVTIQRKVVSSYLLNQQSKSPQNNKPTYILYNNISLNKHILIIADQFTISLYHLVVDFDNEYIGKSDIVELHQKYLRQVFDYDNKQNQFKTFNVKLFQIKQQNNGSNVMVMYYDNKLYKINIDQNNWLTFSKYGTIINNDTNDTVNKIIPLQFGFLIQYEKHIQIYLQSQQINSDSSNTQFNHKTFTPQLSTTSFKQLTNNKSIISVHVQQLASQNSGYKIFILLQSQHIIEFQYGAYTNLFLYNIPYGRRFLDLAFSNTQNKDIIQIIFELERGKMTQNYIVQLFINRQSNPLKPSLQVNRFYDDMTNVKQVQFLNNQLLLIGQYDTMILDYPINSQILINQNIHSHPYHFGINNLLGYQLLTKKSQKQTGVLLLLPNNMIIAKILKHKQYVQCQPQESINTTVQVIVYCPSTATKNKQKSTSVCKYVTNLSISVADQQSLTLEQYKRYLIILLIVVLVILTFVIIKQLIKNKNIINKLNRIKSSIMDKKQRQLKEKGEKIQASQKFTQLQQQIQSDKNDKK